MTVPFGASSGREISPAMALHDAVLTLGRAFTKGGNLLTHM